MSRTVNKTLVFYRSPLSNNWLTPYIVDNVRYWTAQHRYQALKALHFKDVETWKAIIETYDPNQSVAAAQEIKGFDLVEWTRVAESCMYRALKEKFTLNKTSIKTLEETKGHTLVYACKKQDYWGTGLDLEDDGNLDVSKWVGYNALGRLLMQLRDST